MTRTRFQQGLEDLRNRQLAMAGMAERAVALAFEAYRTRDAERARRVLAQEPAINAIEREIDELAFDLLAMQQPMAGDLRFLLAVIKITADLERIGDQAVNIAERVLGLAALPPAALPPEIESMAATTARMMQSAVEAFVRRDPALAEGILELDDIVDQLNRKVFADTIARLGEHPEAAAQAVDALLIARNIERIADHATNIAEDVIFWASGADVRHSSHS